ncbi:MAG: metallophosphoesterase [Myxococcales bacterium]|nr:metallophosphoesterase [Myxococcales bacterium]
MSGRTIIVGDVHGCSAELEALLARVSFGTGDKLVFVGDLVARGPDSIGVLDVARRTGAIIVRGNHEQKLLDWHVGDGRSSLAETHLAVARDMRPIDWTLLETSPFFVDLPEHGARVVHAGVVPGTPIEKQKPDHLIHLRLVDTKADGRVLWGSVYEGPPHVVFGHNAVEGLQLHPNATGLDTGCVYGRALTALVLRDGEPIPVDVAERRKRLVSQPAARVYYDPAARRPIP